MKLEPKRLGYVDMEVLKGQRPEVSLVRSKLIFAWWQQ
jgi:hypothetical protein